MTMMITMKKNSTNSLVKTMRTWKALIRSQVKLNLTLSNKLRMTKKMTTLMRKRCLM